MSAALKKILDVGANFGTYTKFLAELVGKTGEVHAFEPIPEVKGYLEDNLAQAGIENVKVYSLALSNVEGTSNFKIPKFEHSGDNFYEAHLTSLDGDITVNTEKLDNFKFEKGVNFIKCDVEGAELLVLEGALELLKVDRPILMLEINDSLKSKKAEELISFLKNLDYQLKYLGDGELSNSESRFQGVNYFFVPQ